jgi:hypothetical protein
MPCIISPVSFSQLNFFKIGQALYDIVNNGRKRQDAGILALSDILAKLRGDGFRKGIHRCLRYPSQ